MTSPVDDRLGTRVAFSLLPTKYDRVARTATDTVTDTWDYYLENVLVGTIVVVYASTAKNEIDSVERTA